MAIPRYIVHGGRQAIWAETFKAMADQTRLSILLKLLEHEHCVTDLARALDMQAPKVSSHLARLKYAGLVVNERREQRVIYRVNPELVGNAGDGRILDVNGCLLKFPKSA